MGKHATHVQQRSAWQFKMTSKQNVNDNDLGIPQRTGKPKFVLYLFNQ